MMLSDLKNQNRNVINKLSTAAVTQWKSVRLACRRSGFDPLSRQTQVVKTGSGSSTAERLVTGDSLTIINGRPVCHSKDPSLLNEHECRE